MTTSMRDNLNLPAPSVGGDNDSVTNIQFSPKEANDSPINTVNMPKVDNYKPKPVETKPAPVEKIPVLEPKTTPSYAFFLFVNPTSGGNKAAVLTKLDVEKFIFSNFGATEDYVELSIFSLKDKKSKETGLKALKYSLTDEKIRTRVIVGGGDGTIMWVIEEMIKNKIPFDNCPIGCIPFGTGNDFSRVLGWGGEEPAVLVGPNLGGLKTMIAKWMEAITEDFDIWDIKMDTYEEGGFRRVEKETGKKFVKSFMTENQNGKEVNISTFSKKMCNYYSFGIDARIGYGFDKSRTTSRALNKGVYCWEGTKKMFIKTHKVNNVLNEVAHAKEDKYKVPQSPAQEQPQDIEILDKDNDQSIDKIEYDDKNKFLLFPSSHNGEKPAHSTVIKGNPSVFLCLNIPSYMGGASNPWASSKGKSGVTDHKGGAKNDFVDQMFGDGKIEILSFEGAVALGMERFVKGQGRRMGQAEGPFSLNFKRSENSSKPLNTYMQVDGEFFELVAPKSVRLSLCKDLPNGKVKVLKNKEFHLKQQKALGK